MTHCPGAFKDMNSSSWDGLLCFSEVIIPLTQHPPWSPGAGPRGEISWCCGHRNIFVWWSLGGSSRMTPGPVHHWRTVGEGGYLMCNSSQHKGVNRERAISLCRARQNWWLLVMLHYKVHRRRNRGLKTPRPEIWVTATTKPMASYRKVSRPPFLKNTASDDTGLWGRRHEKPRGWVIKCSNPLIRLRNDREDYFI